MNPLYLLGLLPGLLGENGSSSNKPKQLAAKNPQQLQHLKNILGNLGPQGQLGQAQGQGLGILQQYLDPNSDIYSNFEQPYLQNFEQNIVPGLAERFAGAGAMGGGLSSSGFGHALGAAGGNLQAQLAAMKTGLQRSAINDVGSQFNQMSQLGLGIDPFAYYQQQQGPSFGAQAFGQSLPSLLPYLLSL